MRFLSLVLDQIEIVSFLVKTVTDYSALELALICTHLQIHFFSVADLPQLISDSFLRAIGEYLEDS